jgi:hypothetical protein
MNIKDNEGEISITDAIMQDKSRRFRAFPE